MLQTSSNFHQPNLFGNDLLNQLDCNDPLIALANAYDWRELETKLQKYYVSNNGRPAKPIRLMAGLLILMLIGWKENMFRGKIWNKFKKLTRNLQKIFDGILLKGAINNF